MTELVSLNFLKGDRTLDLDPSQLCHGGSDLREGEGEGGYEIKQRRGKGKEDEWKKIEGKGCEDEDRIKNEST